MKFNKFVAALSAVTMLGSLAVAVPASANTINDSVEDVQASIYASVRSNDEDWSEMNKVAEKKHTNSSNTKDDIEITYTYKNGKYVYMGAYFSFNNVIPANVNITSATLKISTKTTWMNYIVIPAASVTDFNEANIWSAVSDAYSTAKNSYGGLYDSTTNGTTTTYTNASKYPCTTGSVTTDGGYVSLDAKSAGVDLSSGSCGFFLVTQYKEGSISGDGRKVYADATLSVDYSYSMSLASNYTKTLYKDESVQFTPSFDPATRVEGVTYTFTGDNKDVATSFKDNGNGSFTYNNVNRVGGTNGKVTVTATSDSGATDTTDIYVQRLRHVSYNITNNTGEASISGLTVTSKVNGETNGFNNADVTTFGSEVSTGNYYSGHSSYSLTFNVPEGYKLTLGTKDGCTISGNTISTNDGVDLNDDFYITGTLTKEQAEPTKAYYSFNGEGNNTYTTIVVNATKGGVTTDGSALIGNITGGTLYVEITNIPAGVTINSVTLK